MVLSLNVLFTQLKNGEKLEDIIDTEDYFMLTVLNLADFLTSSASVISKYKTLSILCGEKYVDECVQIVEF